MAQSPSKKILASAVDDTEKALRRVERLKRTLEDAAALIARGHKEEGLKELEDVLAEMEEEYLKLSVRKKL